MLGMAAPLDFLRDFFLAVLPDKQKLAPAEPGAIDLFTIQICPESLIDRTVGMEVDVRK